jgi:transcriptional regulator with XRE-family HTH domain
MSIQLSAKTRGSTVTGELRKEAGLWLRARREDLGLSQRELARRVNMEYYTFISQIESGRGRVPAERLEDWAGALELEPRDLAKTLMQYYDPYMYRLIFPAPEEETL